MTKLFKCYDCDEEVVKSYWKKDGQDVNVIVLKDVKKQNDECYILIEGGCGFSDFRKAMYDKRLVMVEVK